MPVKVQKKDGRLEDFLRAKVVAGVLKSGADFNQAEEVGRQVETWVQQTAVSGMISSNQIREKVLEVLRGVNPAAATTFESYQKPSGGSEGVPPEGVPPTTPPTDMSPGIPPEETPPSAPPTGMPPEAPNMPPSAPPGEVPPEAPNAPPSL